MTIGDGKWSVGVADEVARAALHTHAARLARAWRLRREDARCRAALHLAHHRSRGTSPSSNGRTTIIDRDASASCPIQSSDSVTTPFRADSLRKPFARLKSPSLTFAPQIVAKASTVQAQGRSWPVRPGFHHRVLPAGSLRKSERRSTMASLRRRPARLSSQ